MRCAHLCPQVLAVPSGDVLCTLTGHLRMVLHCQFNADGQLLVSSSEDATIRVRLSCRLCSLNEKSRGYH